MRVATSGVPVRSASCAVQRAGLPARGQHAHVGGAEQVGDVAAPAEQDDRQPLGGDPGGQLVLQRPVAGDRDQRGAVRRRPEPAGDGVEEDVVALLRVQPADGDDQRPAVVEAELGAHLGAACAAAAGSGGAEHRRHPDVAGAQPAGVVGEVAGGGEHEVGAAHGGALERPQHARGAGRRPRAGRCAA